MAVRVCAEHVARDDLDRAELAQRAGQAEHDAVDDAPLDGGQRDPAEGLQRVGAEAAGGLLLLVADLLEHRHDLADHQRQRHEDGGQHDAGRGEDDLEAGVLQGRAEPAGAAAVDQHQGEADDDRRDRQRQVEQGAEQPLARELVAHQQQRDPDPEDGVDDDGGDRDDHGQAQRVHGVGVVEDAAQVVQAVGERVLADEVHGPGHQQEQVGDDDDAAADQRRCPGRGGCQPDVGLGRLARVLAWVLSHGAPSGAG